MTIRRAHSRKQLLELGFDTYPYIRKPLPEGEWLGILEAKQWGKCHNIFCFFTADSGEHYMLCAFMTHKGVGKGSWYTPQDGGLDLSGSTIQPGQKFMLITSTNAKGNPLWKRAILYAAPVHYG